MSITRALQDRLRPCLLPVCGLCFAYWLAIERPVSKSMTELTTKHHQLSQTVASHAQDAQRTQRELAERRQSEVELKDELKRVQLRGTQLVAQRSEKQAAWMHSTSSAASMTRVFELLQAHQLECLESKVLSEPQNPSADAPVFLKSMSDLLGHSATGKMKPREIRVTLRGRFEDVRSALREMRVALACVYVVSLEMEPEIDGLHIWKLTLLV